MDHGDEDAYARGVHEAQVQSLHYRLDELKSMLARYHTEHREEILRLDQEIEDRVRPLEKFKAGCMYLAGVVASAAGIITAWVKGGPA